MNRNDRSAARRSDVRHAAFAWALAGVLLIGLLVEFGGAVRQPAWQRALATQTLPVPLPARVVQDQVNEAQVRFRQGVAMLHARQYEHALVAFHRVLAIDPNSPDAYVNAGFALLGLKRNREALDFFQGAIDLRQNQLNAYFGLAIALEAQGDLEGAVGAMRSFAHLAGKDDPFQRKAWAALWEWESELRKRREAPVPGAPAAAPVKP